MITVYKKTLTPTEINNGNTTPVLILPAPVAGYVRNIFGATERIVPGTVSYDGLGTTSLSASGDLLYVWANGYIMGEQFIEHSRVFQKYVGPEFLLSTEDPIYWIADSDGTVGDGVYSVTIVYEDMRLPEL